MKKIYAAAALFIAGCSVITVFTACNKNNTDISSTDAPEKPIEFSTDEYGTAYSVGDDGYKYVIETNQANAESTTKNSITGHSFTFPPSVDDTTRQNTTKVKPGVTEKVTTTKSVISKETVKNESKGISVLFKSDGVSKGSTATISVIGEAGKTYSIEFYKNASVLSDTHGLGDIKADANGMAIWTFEIEGDCESGNRKVIIKEKGSDNFVQTSINIR